jgi:hypothetical protein
MMGTRMEATSSTLILAELLLLDHEDCGHGNFSHPTRAETVAIASLRCDEVKICLFGDVCSDEEGTTEPVIKCILFLHRPLLPIPFI